MIQVIFKNLERSEIARDAALERMGNLVEKFPDLRTSRIQLTLEMQNSPVQAGPDSFAVRIQVMQGRYRGVRIAKSASNLYIALADLSDHLLERLNRYGDRVRVKRIRRQRQLSEQAKTR